MTARLLERRAGPRCQVTVFEASSRLGGKLHTRRFGARPIRYESGVAECYDLSALGHDPLKELVGELGLRPVPTGSETVALFGEVVEGDAGVARQFGHDTLEAIRAFRERMAARMTAHQWYRGLGVDHNQHPWARCTWADILDQVTDSTARHYLRITSHADLASEPHLVNGLVGLRNFLKGVPGYVGQYTLDGGMGMLPLRLAQDLRHTRCVVNAPVTRIDGDDRRGYIVTAGAGRAPASHAFDAIVVALPCHQLSRLRWGSEALGRAMAAHAAHYDQSGHYLRVSLLFDRPFWRPHLPGSWLMSDAFGGCCVYDESPTGGSGQSGVLGFLLAGAEALARSRLDDGALVTQAVESLPAVLRDAAREGVVESRVHRWVGVLSGTPGGVPYREPVLAHQPAPEMHRRVTVVGDYLNESTLNGVLRSADLATSLVLTAVSEPPPSRRTERRLPALVAATAAPTSPRRSATAGV